MFKYVYKIKGILYPLQTAYTGLKKKSPKEVVSSAGTQMAKYAQF